MAYKQPGFGNGEKAPMIHSSPLNIISRKKKQAARESEGTVHDRSGVTISANQYAGKTNKQIKKLKEKAAKKAAKAEKRAAEGKKLSKRQQDAIAERDYNIKRESEKSKAKVQKAKNEEIYGRPTGVKTREKLDQKAMEQDYQEQQVADAEASANRFRDPALVDSENRDPAEANVPAVDVVGKKGYDYRGGSSSGIVNPNRTGPGDIRIDYTNREIEEMNRANFGKYDDYGFSPVYEKTGKGWEKHYGVNAGEGKKAKARLEKEWHPMFGSDANFPTKMHDGKEITDYEKMYEMITSKTGQKRSN